MIQKKSLLIFRDFNQKEQIPTNVTFTVKI